MKSPPPTARYRSNLEVPDLEPAFPFAREMSPAVYRTAQAHTVLCDPEIFDRCGYATHDECAVLAHVARATAKPGKPNPWAEIGAHTGWTTAHLALHASHVAAVEPEFCSPVYNKTRDPMRFLVRFEQNLERAAKIARQGFVRPYPMKSATFWGATPDHVGFSGVFVDGEHEPPFPEEDAKLLLPHLLDDCAVVFHDALSPHVQAGVKVLTDAGFRWRAYRTPQMLAVCWRGNIVPPLHAPDPAFDWDGWLKSIRFGAGLPRETLFV